MGLQVNDLIVENSFSASTLTATTLFVGTNNIGGNTSSFNSLSATTFSGGTIYSGGTDLYNIFLTSSDGNDITRVQPGSNITTGGTGNFPIINLVASPSVNNLTFSGSAIGGNVQAGAVTATSLSATTLSGGTILSGGTNLYSIFSTTDTNDITRVQPGSNITTGGTANNPTVSVVASPSVNNLTFSGSAIGGSVQASAGTFTSLSATTLSGGTILSGGTNLYQIFAQTGSTLIHKSGTISGSTFAGNPKKATVTFSTAFANTNYAITITSDTNRTWTWESKAAGSFIINSNANTAFNTGNVDWTATEYGEK